MATTASSRMVNDVPHFYAVREITTATYRVARNAGAAARDACESYEDPDIAGHIGAYFVEHLTVPQAIECAGIYGPLSASELETLRAFTTRDERIAWLRALPFAHGGDSVFAWWMEHQESIVCEHCSVLHGELGNAAREIY